MTRKTKGKSTNIDIILGQNLKEFRTLNGLSQDKLGALVNVSFQQIQKYEQGQNRIPASRLYEFSQILNISLAQLYGDMQQVTGAGSILRFSREDLRILKQLNKPKHKNLKTFVQTQVLP
ncbi:MAG: helix-turn-helix transcriptional regulator [Cyclobacteriaceae bacterium]